MTFRSIALTIIPILLVCLAVLPSVQGQESGITSILDLKYPSQATLQNGVAQVTVTFSVYYNYYRNPQGYLVFGVADPSASEYVKGTATATPLPCQPVTETKYANAALCAVIPPSSSGTESASFTLTFNSPRQYSLSALTFVWDSRNLLSGNMATGSNNNANFEITVTGQAQSSTNTGTITSLQNPARVPPAGSWWTLKGNWRRVSTGTGSWSGTLTETGKYTKKLTVTDVNSDTITISKQEDNEWTCAATGTWSCSSSSGTKSETSQYAISLKTFKVISVGGDGDKDYVGHPTYVIVNIEQLAEGGKLTQVWWVPNSNGDDDNIADRDFSVDTQTATIKGTQLRAWRLSYTGDVIGWYHNDNGVFSKGPATLTDLFEPVYGLEVAYSYRANTNGVEVGGGGTWNEVYSDDYQLDDTNLSMTAPVTTSSQTTTAATTISMSTQTSMSVQTTEVTHTSGVMTSIVTQTVVTEPFSIGGTGLMAIIGLVAVIAIIAAWLVMRSRSKPRPASVSGPQIPVSVPKEFCIACGRPLAADAKFCGSCGNAQT